MNFGFSDEQRMLRDSIRRFLVHEMPVTRVREQIETTGRGHDVGVWKKAAALGWPGLLTPEEHGGSGQSIVDAVIVAEELGRGVQPGPFLPAMVASVALSEAGTANQRQNILARAAEGSVILTWAPPSAGGDPAPDALHAEARGDGFVLAGTVPIVQDAHVADYMVVTARSDDGPRQFVVPMGADNVDVRVLSALDLTRRLCRVEIAGLPLDADWVMPGGDPVPAAITRQQACALVLQCAESVGVAQRLLEMTVEYARDRVQFGRPIGSFQAVKHKCANMLVWLEASKAATYYAALAFQDRMPDMELAASVAKSYVGQACSDLAGEALQIHGGIGFTWEHDLHLYLRRAKSNEALLGGPSWHRERICQLIGV